MSKQTVSIDFNGKEYSLETGRLAKFADGSIMVRCGDSMVLVTAVASTHSKDDIDYLPMQVEYREKTAAAGKFPGGFIKREMRPNDANVLASRLIDRPIRPLLPKTWRYETQVLATVFSFDPEVDPETLGAVGASAALLISDIPFDGPISEVRVGRIDGEFIMNPSFEKLQESDIDLIVSGTNASINMVEGECKEISEEEFVKTLDFAHENIIKLNNMQLELQKLVGKEKREFAEVPTYDDIDSFVESKMVDKVQEYIDSNTTKDERTLWRRAAKKEISELVEAEFGENEEYKNLKISEIAFEALEAIEKRIMRKAIIDKGVRFDGRSLTDIRQITCETGILPRVHGSSLFTRGETQSLTSVTLGTKRDEKLIDGLLPTYAETFYLHYNFPPYCTGEVKRLGVGRREIGHGHLAERALKGMIPDHDKFAYTVRVVSDILESNGSSSMATVCAGSLALYDAGVPMKKAVSGIAMGLIREGDKIAVLSDILGDEDHLGDMDFKVTGTEDGITACQMDIKIEGLSKEIITTALDQAREGRLHILNEMNKSINTPNEEVSMYAPRFTVIHVPKESIGMVIGPGGETIRSICAETETDINIDDDGKVVIASTEPGTGEAALAIINDLLKKPEEGEVYKSTVKEIREGLGAFVEFLPKRQGLLHISQISHERTENVADVLSEGDEIEVKLLEITRDGKFRLSMKALQPMPDHIKEMLEKRGPRPPRKEYNNRRPGGDSRGGGRGRDSRDSRDSRDNRDRR